MINVNDATFSEHRGQVRGVEFTGTVSVNFSGLIAHEELDAHRDHFEQKFRECLHHQIYGDIKYVWNQLQPHLLLSYWTDPRMWDLIERLNALLQLPKNLTKTLTNGENGF